MSVNLVGLSFCHSGWASIGWNVVAQPALIEIHFTLPKPLISKSFNRDTPIIIEAN